MASKTSRAANVRSRCGSFYAASLTLVTSAYSTKRTYLPSRLHVCCWEKTGRIASASFPLVTPHRKFEGRQCGTSDYLCLWLSCSFRVSAAFCADFLRSPAVRPVLGCRPSSCQSDSDISTP